MNRYKRLIKNFFVFGIGTFSSKVLVFLLMPLYTRVLTDGEYGVVDLLTGTGNLLIPIFTLGIVQAVIRFGLDKNVRKDQVFTTGMMTVFVSFLAMLLFIPVFLGFELIAPYTALFYVFVLMSATRQLASQFVRAKGYVKLYAADGCISTVTTCLFTALYLAVFRWGISGYIGAIITADTLSTLFLFVMADLKKYFRPRHMSRSVTAAMLRYSIPMIPNTIFWWLTNQSDRYMIVFFLNENINGLYAVAYKIPSIIMMVSSIFTEAWQISAMEDATQKERNEFFSKIFQTYSSIVFFVASGLIMADQLIITVLTGPDFHAAWQFVPFLIIATAFSCLVSFLGSIYMVEKKGNLSLATTAVGTVLNVILNLLLIPRMGANGAAFATFASYFLVLFLRLFSTRRFVKIHAKMPRLLFTTILLLIQSIVIIDQVPGWLAIEIALFLAVTVINMRGFLRDAKRLISQRKA